MIAMMIAQVKCQVRALFDTAKGNPAATQVLSGFEAKFAPGGDFEKLTVVKTAIDCLKDDSKALNTCATDPTLPATFMMNPELQGQMMGLKNAMTSEGDSFKTAVESKAKDLCQN